MAASDEQIPVEEISNSESYAEYKVKEMIEYINEILSLKDNYEEKDLLFKQNLQQELFGIIKTYDVEIKKIADTYEESSNNNTYLRDVERLDEETRVRIEQKIDQTLRKEYVPPPKEVIEQRQREWLKASDNRAREFARTFEGRKYKAAEKERQRVSYLNRKDPLIKKIRQASYGENISREMKELDDKIAERDPLVRATISRAERYFKEMGDIQLRKISEEYDLKRENAKRMFAERPRQYPSNDENYAARMKQIDEDEEFAKRPIRVRTEDSIIYMKTDYLRTGKLPEIQPLPESENEYEPEKEPEKKPEIVELEKPAPRAEPALDYDILYTQSIIHHKISVPFNNIGSNMDNYFKKHAIRYIEGKCRKEGYIRPNSIKVVSYSTGLLNADNVIYDVVYSADVCFPCEDMIIKCKIVNITKIGIRAIISEIHNPIVLFISREHNATKNFEDYDEGNVINIKVIGHRFELNDEYISVIGEII
jgi:DNA-directed RNA polymerase subunit E'/Rpb7